jgi:hypothetical protein
LSGTRLFEKGKKKITPRSVRNTLDRKKTPAHLVNKPSKNQFFFTPPKIPKPGKIRTRVAASCEKISG